MDVLSHIANSLTSPLVHVPVLIAIAIAIKRFGILPKFTNFLMVLSVGWLMFCSMTYTSVLLVYPLEHRYPSIEADSDNWLGAEAIVVLACYYYDDDALPFVSRWPDCSLKRNLQASLMYKHSARKIYLTGGGLGKSEHSLAYFNAGFLKHMGVGASDIHILEKGFNTASESKALRHQLGEGEQSIALVASATQMIRAVNYFEGQGFRVFPIPVEHLSKKKQSFMIGLPNSRSLYRSERAIHEYLGLIKQYIFE